MAKILLIALAALPLGGVLAAPLLPKKPPIEKHPTDSRKYTTGKFEGCDPWGVGGDPYLNQLKNRDRPASTFKAVPIQQLLDYAPAKAVAMGKKARWKWTQTALKQVFGREQKYVMIEGFMVKAKDEEGEACNCGDGEQVDTHTWLAAQRDGDWKTQGLVAEVSPRLKQLHPDWSEQGFEEYLKTNQLRVYGWLMWDQEHLSQVGQYRGTAWEIHPIHRIQYHAEDGTWKDL
ncbi:MAG: hypothetical protein QOJ65_1972 [Fimbriimonadaceae bacterium]|jgi:hypothetical protein|nr:hypothetical protein [Fimbriimonadaceae bacterium]